MKHLKAVFSRCLFQVGNRCFNLVFLGLFFSKILHGQIMYGTFFDFVAGQAYMIKINLNTCTFCAITPNSLNVGDLDLVLLPDGNHLHISNINLSRLLPPPSTQAIWQTINFPGKIYSGQLAPNGLVYLGGEPGFSVFDPATNTVTSIGNWPPGVLGVVDLFYINGVLYGAGYDGFGASFFLQVNIANPSQSIILGAYPFLGGVEGGTWNGNAGIFAGDALGDLYFYNPADSTSTLVCDIPADGIISGLSFPPPGLPEYGCIINCTTNAGTLPSGGPYNICTNSTLSFPATTGTVLDANDNLRYILFSNPSDTAGSIVATSATPNFNFASPLQTGVTYYIAAIAGNNLNGNVDLNDPCLDFSNALQVEWKPLPAVTFSVTNPNVCAGACTTVTATFTGTAPFTLSYTNPATGSVTQTFSGNTGTFQVCTLPGSPPGSLVVPATALTDALCTCQ